MTGGSPALAGVLGAGTGLGMILAWRGLRGTPAPGPRWRAALARARRQAAGPKTVVALLAFAVAAAVTRWPVGAVLAGLAVWYLPPMLGADRDQAAALERIEAIAAWTEQLRDTLAGAAGLEQAILATAAIAPAPVAGQVAALAASIHRGQPLAGALRAFAAHAADPAADLVAAALLLTVEQQARDLGPLLSSLADSARQHAAMRMRIAASRARVRTAARIIIAVTAALTVGLLVWGRAFLAPYDSVTGQLMLAVLGGCFSAAFWWLHRISAIGQPPRILAQPGPGPEPDR